MKIFFINSIHKQKELVEIYQNIYGFARLCSFESILAEVKVVG